MNECVEMAAEFARRIGHEAHLTPTRRSPGIAETRVRLIVEELAEAVAAANDGDIVGLADGMADLLYVVAGAGAAWGEDVPVEFIEPCAPPARPDPASVIRFTRESAVQVAAVARGAEKGGGEELGDSLALLGGVVTAYAAVWGLPLRELFLEVHRSNMTKTKASGVGDAKYGPGGKGPAYLPPDVEGVLGRARERLQKA